MLLGYLAEHTSLGRRYSGHSWITVRPQPSGSDRGITTPKRVNRTMKIPFVIKAWQGRTLLGIRKGYCVNLVEMRDGSRNGRAMSGMANGNNGRGNSGNKHNGRLLEDKKNGSANSSSSNKGGHINNIISSSSNNNNNNKENLSTNKRRKRTLLGILMSMIHGQFSAYHAVHQRMKCPKLFEEKCLSIIPTYSHKLLKKRRGELLKGRSSYQTHTEKLRQALRSNIF
mmetsp:Transcript_37429/g.78425  ORF Transcript_37429/g.78425 Transcript_37429/m.78425 type:complete len:227 (+) Transcript_37429:1022-1702(+)